MGRKARIVIGALVAPIVIGVAALGISLANAEIETSVHGVHTRLMLPLPTGRAIGINMFGGTADNPYLPGYLDGPVVRRAAEGWEATWFCEREAVTRRVAGNSLDIECGGQRTHYVLEAPAVPAAASPMPAKVAVLSDIEGNKDFLDAALVKLGVTGPHGEWNYGANHLVIVGDAVDRGRDVFAVLWTLHQLALQAQAQGGAVTLVIGNHEQYVMRGNLSRAHPEHIYSAGQIGGFAAAYGKGSVIGDWLRAQPVVHQLGDVLFVHGGISPAVAKQGYQPVQLNEAMRNYWHGQSAPGALDAAIAQEGVTQFRGYVGLKELQLPQISEAELDAILTQYGVKHIVIGHTIVERVKPLFGGKVYAVDVNDNSAAPEALVIEQRRPTIVDIGVKRRLVERLPTKVRPLALADFPALGQSFSTMRALSNIPKPY